MLEHIVKICHTSLKNTAKVSGYQCAANCCKQAFNSIQFNLFAIIQDKHKNMEMNLAMSNTMIQQSNTLPPLHPSTAPTHAHCTAHKYHTNISHSSRAASHHKISNNSSSKCTQKCKSVGKSSKLKK